jgi:glucose/arabinose dehydrogenase
MARMLWLTSLILGVAQSTSAGDAKPKPLVSGLKNLSAVTVGGDGRIYVVIAGGEDFQLGGAEAPASGVYVINQGKAVPFFDGKLGGESRIATFQKWLFVTDLTRILKIDPKGKMDVFVPASAFLPPDKSPDNFAKGLADAFERQSPSLSGLTIDPESGILYVTGLNKKGGMIYRIDPKGKMSVVTSRERWSELRAPTALVMDGASHLLLAESDGNTGALHRVKIADGSHEKLADGLRGPTSLAWDMYGRIFVCDAKGKRLLSIPRPGMTPTPLAEELELPVGVCLDPSRTSLLIADAKAGTITAIPAQVPGQPVDFSPLPFETAVAFPDLKWSGWQGETDAGKPNPLRPLVLTHAGDGSNRNFVATQQGVIHVFPNDQKVKETKVFLDIQDKVRYKDQENEEGFLGLAFHPDYKKTGEFFVFYTPKKEKLVNVVSRFRVSKDDPDRADPASEEEIFRVKRPFWNHDGGTIVFGPDGMLYIALGDGGAANDPFGNGQNLKQPLGKVLRIDINKKDPGKNYAIPPDNPFDDLKDAIPETWAYGLRNVWRMAFDKKTGKLWAADVGQNLYEEIDIIERGGNYGWRLREGLHPFGPGGSGPRKDLIDPIWEYHHDIGKSLTGGFVYRGKQFPELDGYYLCADYVTGKIWALKYSEKEKRVTEWRTIRDKSLPIMSFGEDDRGEAYLMTYAASGRGIYRLVRSEKK